MISSRRAKILIPLAVELTFALAVFLAIRLTDGARYGLGAKAALRHLVERYHTCETYAVTVREVLGEYPKLETPSSGTTKALRTFHLVYQKPSRAAGAVTQGESVTYYILNNMNVGREGDGLKYFIGSPVAPIDPRPWRGPLVHWIFLPTESIHFLIYPESWLFSFGQGDYLELRRMRGPSGAAHNVLVLTGRETETEFWLSADRGHVCALVRKHRRQPYTELYDDVVFEAPVDDAIFEIGGEGFKRLKQWIAERESAPTK